MLFISFWIEDNKNRDLKCFYEKRSSFLLLSIQTEIRSTIKNESMSNKELSEEIHKPIIRKFNDRKVHSSFADNIWAADLADIQLTSKFNKGIRFLSIIDIFSK